jgi:hypothetical protein
MTYGEAPKVTSPGVYELATGEVYVVKFNKERFRLYAKKLVESSERLTETGKVVDFDFVYEPGAIYRLRPEDQMGLERAKELLIRYGRCIVCGRTLKVAKSVERGLGPVCVKYFKGATSDPEQDEIDREAEIEDIQNRAAYSRDVFGGV